MVNNSSNKFLIAIIVVVLAIVFILVPLAYFFLLGGSISDVDDNKAPVIEGVSPKSSANLAQGQSRVFTITCNDPDGDILTYTWKVDGNTVKPTTTYRYETSYTFAPNETILGKLTIEVRVSDGESETSQTWNVTVRMPNRRPIVVAAVDTFEMKIGEPFSFDGSGSSDPNGDELSYLWTFGDGETSSTMSPKHAYRIPGKFSIVLEVTDGELKGSDTFNVNVTGLYLWKIGPLLDSETVKIMVDDVDDDGSEEMVVGINYGQGDNEVGHGKIYIYDMATQELEWSSPDIGAISDFEMENVDDDPAVEIVVGAMTDATEEGSMSGFGYVFDGSSHEEEWRSVNIGGVSGVEIGNADDDPALEMVFSYVRLTAFDMTTFTLTMKGGIIVLGSDYLEEWRSTGYGASDILFVGDLDGDSSNELLISTSSSMGLTGMELNTSVIAWNGGSYDEVLTRNDTLLERTMVVDLDGDGDMEIITEESTEDAYGTSGSVTLYDHTLSAQWTSDDIGSVYGLAVGDIDGDGDLEILAGGFEGEFSWPDGKKLHGYLYIFDDQGNQEWKSERIGKIHSIVIDDLRGDNGNEIAMMVEEGTDEDEKLISFISVLDGSSRNEVSKIPSYANTLPFELACVDCDGNGKEDLLFGTNENGKGYITMYKLD